MGGRALKICMLVRNAFVRDVRVLREARSLAGAGHDVVVVAVRRGDLPRREEKDGFSVERVVDAPSAAGPTVTGADGARTPPRLPMLVWARDKMLSRRMTRAALARRADVYHAHDLNTLAAASTAAARHGARLVYDAHELYPDMTGFGRGESARWRRLETRLIGRADVVIAPSHSRAEELARRYGISPPTVVMNCPPSVAVPARLGPPAAIRRPGETLLVYAGGYSPNRGLENLVRALDLLGGCRLAMLGWGSLEAELRALATERVTFVPPVDPDDVVAVISEADVGLAPYLPVGRNNELAAPNKLFEYLHAGLAVAASDLPDIRRIVEEHRVGRLFDASDPASIASAIKEAIANLDELKANARAAARLYSWEAQERVLLDVYSGLAVSR